MSKKNISNLNKYKKKKYSYSHKSKSNKNKYKERLEKLKKEKEQKEKEERLIEKQEADIEISDSKEIEINIENKIDDKNGGKIEQDKQETTKDETEKSNSLFEHIKTYKKYYFPIIAIILTLIVYTTAFDNDFINWDDDRYVTLNQNLDFTWDNVKTYFTDYYFVMYIPLTMVSYMIDYSIVGIDSPQFYHAHNILLHLINTLLVYFFILLLIKKIDNKKAWFYALISAILFGIHPLHVESVTWIAERKDVLFAMYFLASLISYLFYTKKNNLIFYFLALFLFGLSLLSKSQAVVLPVVLILIDYFTNKISLTKENIIKFFKEKRFFKERVINDKILFFVIAALFGVLAIVASGTNEPFAENISTEKISTQETYSIAETIVYMNYGLIEYCNKLIVPYNLCAIHTYPQDDAGNIPWYLYLYPIGVLLLIGGVIYAFIKKKKYFVFSILFFIVNIFLVLHIKNFIISEHYSYIPSISLNILLVFIYFKILQKNNKLKPLLNFVLIAYIIFLGSFTFIRNDVFQNSETFWTDVIKKEPSVIVSTYNRGNYYQELGDEAIKDGNMDEAMEYYQKAIADYDSTVSKHKYNVGAFANRGVTNAKIGKTEEAIMDFNEVIKIDSTYGNVYSNRGNAFAILQKWEKSIKDYNLSIKLNPNFSDAYYNRGVAKKTIGRFESAIEDFNKVIELGDNYSQVFFQRGESYFYLKQFDKALLDINRHLEIKSDYKYAYYYKALIYREQGEMEKSQENFVILRDKFPEFIDDLMVNADATEKNGDYSGQSRFYNKALDIYNDILLINPDFSLAYSRMAVVKGKLGNIPQAIDDLNIAIKLDENNIQAYADRGYAYYLLRNYKKAISDYNFTLEKDPNNADTYFNRGVLFNSLNKFNKAINDFTNSLKLKPNNAMAYFNRGISYINIKEKEKGCADFNKAKELGLKSAENYIKKYCK